MNFMYIRVSTQQQDLYRQEELSKQLIKNGQIDEVYSEKASAKDTERPVFKSLLSKCRKGDCITVESISRLCRSMTDFFNLIQEFKSREIIFKSIDEPYVNTDSNNPFGEVLGLFMAKMAEMERELIKKRQRAGIDKAKREGRYKGRKKIEIKNEKIFETLYKQWANREIKSKDFMIALGLKQKTFYRRIAEYKKQNNIIQTEKHLEKQMKELNKQVRENKQNRENKKNTQ